MFQEQDLKSNLSGRQRQIKVKFFQDELVTVIAKK